MPEHYRTLEYADDVPLTTRPPEKRDVQKVPKTPDALRARLTELGLWLPVDETILTAENNSPLAQTLRIGTTTIGNRWCIHPMEGWDANSDGSPTKDVRRRWARIGQSGAKLIWGCEAAAVQPDGRANPNQTLAVPKNRKGLTELLHLLRIAHEKMYGMIEDLLVGLQLTHSGRFCKPNDKTHFEPRIAYHHPLLDAKFRIDPHDMSCVWTDDDLERLIDQYVIAAGIARDTGFQFVDVKACHGYLLHEFLSAFTRDGKFGGDFEGRTRLLRTIIARIKAAYPDLMIGVRLSAFDTVPYETSTEVGRPMSHEHLGKYHYAFGVDPDDPFQIDLREPIHLLTALRNEGVTMVNITAGSPYYCPHIQRPAFYPPSDGYQPPEDPLVGVYRLLEASRCCKAAVPGLTVVGTGYTVLQECLPHAAQGAVREKYADVVGIGRMVLSYPQLPRHVLADGRLTYRKKICRTFSACTTAPRKGLRSGCYPFDPYYKNSPDGKKLEELENASRSSKEK